MVSSVWLLSLSSKISSLRQPATHIKSEVGRVALLCLKIFLEFQSMLRCDRGFGTDSELFV